MNVLIIEDEPQAAERLGTLLGELDLSLHILDKIDSVRKAVQWFNANRAPDLIFIDIQLADGLSFEIFDRVEILAPVIFTTAYDEYALRAFKVNSIDYILKPVDKDELQAALKKYQQLALGRVTPSGMLESIGNAILMLTRKYKERFVIKVGEHLKSLEVSEILFLFSFDKATFAQTRDGRKHVLDFTLDQLEGLLNPDNFFRINRKYLVSPGSIQDMISYTNSRLKVILKTSEDKDVIIARERVQEFKDWLDR